MEEVREFRSDSGRILTIQQNDSDWNHPHGNFVVYYDGKPVWDEWSYEASNNTNVPTIVDPPNTNVTPNVPNNSNATPSASIPAKIASNCNSMGMAYWRNINNHKGRNYLYMFLSMSDELHVFTVDKKTLNVTDVKRLGIHHTGEDCYFSAINPNSLFVRTDKELYTVDVVSGDRRTIWRVDGDINLWQCHSSYDERFHSATIKNNNYDITRWAVLTPNDIKYFELKGDPDECQVDKSGKWLLVKETVGPEDSRNEYNRIINIETRQERFVNDHDGAVGHSDCGFGFAMGEFDKASRGGVLNKINFADGDQQQLFSTGIWNMGYVSFSNALPGVPLSQQRCLMTTPYDLISVKLDGSEEGTRICSHGNETLPIHPLYYMHRPKASLCPLGEYASYSSFVGGSLNAYIVKVTNG